MLCHGAINIQHMHAWLIVLAVYTHVSRSQCIVLVNEILHRQNKHWLYIYLQTNYSQYLSIVKQVKPVTCDNGEWQKPLSCNILAHEECILSTFCGISKFFNTFMSLQYLCYSMLTILKCP